MRKTRADFRRGELVVYRMQKYSAHPGPRAADVEPEPQGERYVYHVDKYWVVADVASDGSIVVVTRTGKKRRLEPGDTRLRSARWWERWFLKSRFPSSPDTAAIVAGSSNSVPSQAN